MKSFQFFRSELDVISYVYYKGLFEETVYGWKWKNLHEGHMACGPYEISE